MKFAIIFLSSILSSMVTAKEIFPAGCAPLVVNAERIVIPLGEPRIIMIHNLSLLDLWITHPGKSTFADAGWSSRLQAGHWSALSMDKKSFELSCIESRPGHEQQVSCADVVGICEWPTTARPTKPSGMFWAGEDMPLLPLTAFIQRRGFVVPSSI